MEVKVTVNEKRVKYQKSKNSKIIFPIRPWDRKPLLFFQGRGARAWKMNAEKGVNLGPYFEGVFVLF